MSNKVTKESIFENNLFSDVNKGASELTDTLKSLITGFEQLLKKTKEFAENNKIENSKDILDLNKALTEGNTIAATSIKTKKELALATEEEIKARIKSQQALAAQKKELKDVIVLEDKEAGTLAKLRAENSQLTKEREKLNLSTKEGQDRLKEINAQLDKNNLFIKNNSDALTKQRLNVGNYTESIKRALKESGLFGESLERITSISEKAAVVYELLHGAIHKVSELLGLNTHAVEANTIATEANTAAIETEAAVTETTTAATEANVAIKEEAVIATEAAAVASTAHAGALEAEAVATEAAEIATGRLSKALAFIQKNPVLLIIAGLAAVITAIEAVVTSTQEGTDAQNSLKEATEAGAKAATQFGAETKGYTVNVKAAAEAARELADAEHELRDESDKNIINFAILEKAAAKARLDAEKENATTQEKIDLLKDVIKTRGELAEIQKEEALKEFAITLGLTNSTEDLIAAKQVLNDKLTDGVAITRQSLSENFKYAVGEDQVKKADLAAKKIIDIDTNLATENVRITRRLSTLEEQDRDKRLQLLQNAKKQEIDAIRITATDKTEIITQSRDKDLKIEQNRYDVELENLKKQQEKLGLIADPAVRSQEEADFNREQEAAEKLHLTNVFNINKKANEELSKEDKLQSEKRLKEQQAFIKAELDLLDQRLKLIKEHFEEDKKNAAATISADLEIASSKARVDSLQAKTDDEKLKAAQETENASFQIKLEGLKSLNLTKDKYNELIEQAEKEHQANLEKIRKEAASKEEAENLERVNQILSATQSELDKKNEIKNAALDRDISNEQKAIDRQTELAANGYANQLTFEKAQLAKSELAKKEALKKQQKEAESIKLAEMLLSAVEQKLNAGEDFSRAIAEGLEEVLVVKGIARTISGAFFHGSEKVENDLKPSLKTGKDDYLIRVDGKERILTGEQNEAVGNMSNWELANLASMHQKGEYLPSYAMETGITSSMGQNMANSAMLQQLATMNRKLSALDRIANKPETTIHLDNLGQVITEQVNQGIKRRTTNARPRI